MHRDLRFARGKQGRGENLASDPLAGNKQRRCFNKTSVCLIPREVGTDGLGAPEQQRQRAGHFHHRLKPLDSAAIQPDALRPQPEAVGCRISHDRGYQPQEVEGSAGISQEFGRGNAGVGIDSKSPNSGGGIVAIGEAPCPSTGRFPIELRFEVTGETVPWHTVIQKDMASGGKALPIARCHRRTVGCAAVIGQSQGFRAQTSVSVKEFFQWVIVFGGGQEESREGTQQVCSNFRVEKDVKQSVTADRGAAGKDGPVAHLSRNDFRVEIFRPFDPDPLVVRLTVPISRSQFDQERERSVVLGGDEAIAGGQQPGIGALLKYQPSNEQSCAGCLVDTVGQGFGDVRSPGSAG